MINWGQTPIYQERDVRTIKNAILSIVLYLARTAMRIIYFFIKLCTKQQNKVTMLSRQSDDINLDFILLKEEIKQSLNNSNELLEIKILCKKIPNGILGKIKYCFYIVKCMYHIATSKVCIIDGYNIAISALNHKKNIEIIQIWHAMGAIKKFGYQVLDKAEGSNSRVAKIMKMHANYTCITCTSEATKRIYSEAFNTDLDKVQVLGMPRIDYLLGEEINKKVEEIIKETPKLKGKKNILYVPTFRKEKSVDVQKIIDAVDEEKYNLILQLHPLDKTPVELKYKVEASTEDLIKLADYVITDYSAVAFEAATLDKPLFFYLYDLEEYGNTRGLNINLEEEMKNNTKTNINDIIDIIASNTYNYEELKHFKEKYVQTADTKNCERIVEYIKKAI